MSSFINVTFINVFYLNVSLIQQDVTSGFSFLVTSKETEFFLI